jgi:hypothetical protein
MTEKRDFPITPDILQIDRTGQLRLNPSCGSLSDRADLASLFDDVKQGKSPAGTEQDATAASIRFRVTGLL